MVIVADLSCNKFVNYNGYYNIFLGVVFMYKIKLVLAVTIFSFFGIIATNIGEVHAKEPVQSKGSLNMTHVRSSLDFATVRSNIIKFLDKKNLELFTEFNHAKNAKEVDIALLPKTVLVFGNPIMGTKLMKEFDGIGIVLPLKVLISQDKDKVVWVSYQNLAEVFAPYGVKENHPVVVKMQALIVGLANTTTK